METLTLENLPKAVANLTETVSEIKRLLLSKSNEQSATNPKWLNLQELCNYLPDKPASATCYGWVHFRKIPFHKTGKKLRFLKSEIDAWLETGKNKTISEIEAEAHTYLKKKKE